MAEVAAVRDIAKPVETLLVADAMTGQDAVNTATLFDQKVGITGIILTRIDGDARGGAALSMRAVTGKPIKLLGTGEKWDAIEPFYPERIAGRILGMGDVVSLVERATESIQAEDAQRMAEKFNEGKFDFNDLLTQMRQMKNMGGAGAMMKMLPGLGKMASQIDAANLDDTVLKKQEAIILSMTKAERDKPQIMNASRRKRIADGSGTTVQDVNKICKQQQDMQTVMKRIKKMGMGKMMGMMKNMMGGKADELELMAQSMDPKGLGADMAAMPQGGALPGLGGMGGFGGGLPGLGGMGGMGMPGQNFPMRGGTKKNRKKKR
jgi:signal recognition particle subunit SRP54